jgi:superfamily II DNA or RNA helicase
VVEQYFKADRLSAGTTNLRRWQEEAIRVTLPRIFDEPILIEACPGAGKTHFGLEVAYRLLASGQISRVLVIVPSLAIADGWMRSASRADRFAPTVPLLGPRSWRPVDPIGDRWVGAVATYQSLFSASDMYLAHATDPGHRTLVVFDEIHHAGVESAWGIRAQESFAQYAEAILCLTGTPFRTDQDAIAFVPSEGGYATPHYRYGYGDAIRDQACRPVQFVHARGETVFRTEDGVTHTVSFDDDLTDAGERKRLRTALEVVTPGSIADVLLADANEYLLTLRRLGDPDAAGLVVCVDCDHADRVAGFMETYVLGTRPVVACSRLHDPSDPEPAHAIRSYRVGHDPWLVAVNMVSEGVDIRRLRAVVYLTNRLTLLSFRQIVGRVVRIDPSNVDDHGRVYIPADPSLVQMASAIAKEVELLPPPMTISTDKRTPSRIAIEDDGGHARTEFKAVASFGAQGGASDTFGREAGHELMRIATEYVKMKGLTNTDPASLALAASENTELHAALREAVDGG